MLSLSVVDFVIMLLKDVLLNFVFSPIYFRGTKKYLDFVSCGRMTAYKMKFISSLFNYFLNFM